MPSLRQPMIATLWRVGVGAGMLVVAGAALLLAWLTAFPTVQPALVVRYSPSFRAVFTAATCLDGDAELDRRLDRMGSLATQAGFLCRTAASSGMAPQVRRCALHVIAHQRIAACVRDVVALVGNGHDVSIAYAAEDALVAIGAPAVPPLIVALGDQDDGMLANDAARTLMRIRSPAVDTALFAAMRTHDPDTYDRAMSVLRHRGHSVSEILAQVGP